MIRRYGLLAAALILLALAGGQDRASASPPPEGWGAAELQIAAAYWGVTAPPLCASTSVEFDVAPDPEFAGFATQPTEAGTACQMWIAPPPFAGTRIGLYFQCLAVIHEYGHWMGLGHSADTSSPLAATLNETIYVRGCAKLAGLKRSSVTKITHGAGIPR